MDSTSQSGASRNAAFFTSSSSSNRPGSSGVEGAASRGGEQDDDEYLSPLEREVLEEYAKLAGNLDQLSAVLASLAANPSVEILDALRGLERKTSTVFTLLKASVYSIVLQQAIADGS